MAQVVNTFWGFDPTQYGWTWERYYWLAREIGEEEAQRVIEKGIPLNKPEWIPSVQVPQIVRGCEGVARLYAAHGMGVIETWDPRNPYAHLSPEFLAIASQPPEPVYQVTVNGEPMEARTLPAAVGGTAPNADQSIDGGVWGSMSRWMDENPGLALGALGTVAALAVLGGRRRR